MAKRKPVPDDCDGTDDCPSEGHITFRGGGHHKVRYGHIDLTSGHLKTIAERTPKHTCTSKYSLGGGE